MPLFLAGRAFSQDDPQCDDIDMMEQAGAIEDASRWHVHIHSPTTKTILHVESGLLFASDPAERFNLHLVQGRGAAVPAMPADQLELVAYAATLCAPLAVVTKRRRAERGQRGAFFLFCADRGEKRGIFNEDAPPLPRVTRFAA